MTPKIFDLVPWAMAMPPLPQAILIALSCTLFVFALWFVVIETRRRGDWVAVFAMMGGGLAVIYEPLGDILVSTLYPVHGQIGWISLFGRQIPLFIGVLYFWYMSVPALYFLRRVERGLSRASLWRLYALTVVLAIGIEIFGVNLGAWAYYGPQPFVLLGVPLWCPMTYSAFVITISMGLQAMVANLDRRHHWLIVFGVPLFMAGGHCAVTLPTAAAMFSTDNPLWIAAGAAVSSALSLLLVYAASLVYCSDGKRAAVSTANLAWPRAAQAQP